MGQTNITEIDPAGYDIGWWRQQWRRTRIQGVIINAGGIFAYYPSKYPLHYRPAALGDRDLFGELAAAAREDGLVVFARMDSNRTHEDFFRAHPEWFAVDAAGEPYRAGELYVTCVNSPYYDEYLPAILREIIDRSHPEGFTDNSWSGLDRNSICFRDVHTKRVHGMTAQSNTRRRFLKRVGLGTGMVGSGVSGWSNQTNATEDQPESQVAPRPKMATLGRFDVVVAGGGPAGIGAALGAARAGAKTLLVESEGFFGGVAAWSLGMPINQMRPESKPRSVVHELLIQKLLAYGDQAVYIGQHQLYCNVDYLKVAVLDALDEVGCKYLVHLLAVDTLVQGDRVTGLVVSTKQGLATISAKVVVDCTGDADVAYFAGAETMMETEAPRMPSTLLLGLANVPPEKVCAANIRKLADSARSKYPLIPKSWGLGPVSNCHHYFVNHTGTRDIGPFDMTDPLQRSDAECVSRRQALQMTQAMREFGGQELKDTELVELLVHGLQCARLGVSKASTFLPRKMRPRAARSMMRLPGEAATWI